MLINHLAYGVFSVIGGTIYSNIYVTQIFWDCGWVVRNIIWNIDQGMYAMYVMVADFPLDRQRLRPQILLTKYQTIE